MLHLLLQLVTLCFTYADDDDDLQTGAEDGWVTFNLPSFESAYAYVRRSHIENL